MEIVSETDPYEVKLFHMFQSHDVNRAGCLDREALTKLCKTLELKERGQLLVNSLLKTNGSKNDKQTKVTFVEFREGLLHFLDTNMDTFASPSKVPTNGAASTAAAAGGVAAATKKTTKSATTATAAAVSSNNKVSSDNEIDNESSDREVSPKFVVGTKKYGRRSRPRDNNDESSLSDSDNENVAAVPSLVNGMLKYKNKSPKVQRSASQSDMHGSKRRRPTSATKLKRCASLPAQKSVDNNMLVKLRHATKNADYNDRRVQEGDSRKKLNFTSISESLLDVWNSFGCVNNYLNISQLAIVCEKIGLSKTASKLAAEEVFEKLLLKSSDGINFDEFMSLLQSDSEILSNVPSHEDLDEEMPKPNTTCHLLNDSVKDLSDISLGNDSASPEIGSLTAAIIVNMWESAGIVNASNLLLELGFYGDDVLISDLTMALEEELQRIGDEKQIGIILKASLALHKAEVNALRLAFLQLVEENKKLHVNSKEANRRAIILAQEVDDRHSSIENLSKIEIQHLEQKHSETIKQLTSQLSSEREQWSSVNSRLEEKLKSYEVEETKMKNQISTLQEEYCALETEQIEVQKHISELLEQNIKLNREISDYEEIERHTLLQNEKTDSEMLELIDQIAALQTENTNLRDKSDEMCAEIEDLNFELTKFKIRKPVTIAPPLSMSNVSPLEEISDESITCNENEQMSSGATKRRGDSPSKTRIIDDSPRLGKFRKCSNDSNNNDESETSGEWVALQSELGQSFKAETSTTSGISSMNEEEHKELKLKIKQLEQTIEEMKNKSQDKMNDSTDAAAHSDVEKARARCNELEASLEQMRKEYEDCEDYWQSKLNEERILYEEEQRTSDDKFADLLNKMSEYEAQFSTKDDEKYGRLSPIEEKCVLEQQYIDLEQELEETRCQSHQMLNAKSAEIDKLKLHIEELKSKIQRNSTSPLPLPVPSKNENIAELESPASSPVQYLWNQSTIQAVSRDYHNPNWKKDPKSKQQDENSDRQIKSDAVVAPPTAEKDTDRIIMPIRKPTSLNLSKSDCDLASQNGNEAFSSDKVDGSCDVASVISVKSNYSVSSAHRLSDDSSRYTPDDLKTIEKKMFDEIRDLAHQRDCLVMELQQLHEAKPILAKAYARASHSNLAQRIQQLEQKNRHLQSVLKQQQQYAESIYHQTWQQQRAEISELRNHLEAQSIVISEQAQRLANADHLVKDLYVENSHLTATIQRLEQQRTRSTLLQLSQHHHQQGLSGVPGMP